TGVSLRTARRSLRVRSSRVCSSKFFLLRTAVSGNVNPATAGRRPSFFVLRLTAGRRSPYFSPGLACLLPTVYIPATYIPSYGAPRLSEENCPGPDGHYLRC